METQEQARTLGSIGLNFKLVHPGSKDPQPGMTPGIYVFVTGGGTVLIPGWRPVSLEEATAIIAQASMISGLATIADQWHEEVRAFVESIGDELVRVESDLADLRAAQREFLERFFALVTRRGVASTRTTTKGGCDGHR